MRVQRGLYDNRQASLLPAVFSLMLSAGISIFAQTDRMFRPSGVLFIIGAVVTLAAVAVALTECKTASNMLDKVADEGYETASDVLYPNRKKAQRKQHYGPVL